MNNVSQRLTRAARTGSYVQPANVSYTYNADQSRATMVDGTETTTYSYDQAGDVIQKALAAKGGLSN